MTVYGPPAPTTPAAPAADPNAPAPAPDPSDYGAQAAAQGQEFQQNNPTQQVNPRTVYNFGKPEIMQGPPEYLPEPGASQPTPPPPGYNFQSANPQQQPNWDKLSDTERAIQNALPGLSGAFADVFSKWDATWPGHTVDQTLGPSWDSFKKAVGAAAGAVSANPTGAAALTTSGNYANVGLLTGPVGGATAAVAGAAAGTVAQAVGGTGAVDFINRLPNFILAGVNSAKELLVRSVGVADQAHEAYANGTMDEFNKNLQAAWYAGSLEAEVAPNGGFHITTTIGPDGKPTLSAGVPDNGLGGTATLVQARQMIAQLMAQGMSPHDALIATRSAWYQKLGALAFRAQTNSLLTDIFVNPVYHALPMLKPFERVVAVQKIVAGMDAAPEALAALDKVATEAEAELKVAMDAHDAAVAAGTATLDTQQAVTDATAKFNQAEGAVEAAGKTNLSWGQQKLVQAFGFGDEEAGRANLIKLGGGLDTRNPLSGKWNPFALTPQSRAQELMTIFNDNITSYHVAANTDAATGKFDLLGAERTVTRAAGGINDPRLGNALLSYEGRSVAPMVKNAANIVTDMATVHRATEFEQGVLAHIAQVIGDTPEAVMARLEQGDPGQVALLNQYMSKAGQTPGALEDLQRLLEPNNLRALDQPTLARVFHVLEKVPYTDQQELATFINKITDGAAQQAILQFGVKQTPLLTRIAEMTKAAESLAHFRVNPTYPIRMFITDTVNMLRDGTFGTMSNGEIDAFWQELGFEPARLYQSTSYTGPEDFAGAGAAKKGAGPMVAAQSQAERGIYQATHAANDPIQKVTRWIGSIKPPDVLNAQNWARDITAMASKRSYTMGYLRGIEQFMPAAVGKLVDHFPDAAAALGPDLSRSFENALHSVRTESELDALLAHPNLNMTTVNVGAQAEADTGLKVNQILDAEFKAKIDPIINDAAKTGDPAVVEAQFKKIETDYQAHLDSLNDQNLPAMRDEAFARTMAEKSGAGPKLWAQANDEIISAQIKHTMDQALLQEQLSGLKGSQASAAWTSMRANDEAFFNRAWDRAETTVNGFAEAANKANLPGGDEMLTQFQNWKGDAQKFIADRNAGWNDFWAAQAKGEKPPIPYGQLVVKNDNAYMALVERERAYQQSLDAGISKMLPPEEQPAYLAWRNRVATLRTADKQAVLDFRRAIQGMKGSQLESAYAQFNQERLGRLGQLAFENSAGQAMMQGVPQASARYTQSVANAKLEMDTLDQLMGAKLSADLQLPPEQQAQLDAVVKKYADPQQSDLLAQIRNEATTEQISPPMRPKAMTPAETAAYEKQVMAEVQGSVNPELQVNAPKNYKINVDTGTVEGPAIVARKANTGGFTEWKNYKILTNAEKDAGWIKTSAHNVDVWVEQQSEKLFGDKNHAWPDIEKAVINQKRGARIMAGDVPIGSLSPDLLKLNPELAGQITPAPQEVNAEALAANQADRAQRQMSIEWDVWQRMSQQADAHAAANAPAAQIAPDTGILPDKRLDWAMRGSIDAMTPEERKTALEILRTPGSISAAQVNETTGMPGKSAWASAVAKGQVGKALVHGDVAGLGWVNDNLGHDAGDALLNAMSAAIKDAGLQDQAYHISGDEFNFHFADQAGAEAQMADLKDKFKNVAITFTDTNGIPHTYSGGFISYGIGANDDAALAERAAEDGLLSAKRDAVASGDRPAIKGTKPSGMVEIPTGSGGGPEGGNVQGGLPPEGQQPLTLDATHPDTAHQTSAAIPDIEQVVKPSLFQNRSLDEHMFTRGQTALDAMKQATLKLVRQEPVNLANIPDAAQAGVRGMIEKAYGDLADARYASMRMGEYTRDSALLNYNRRYNFDSWLSNIFPYEFWTTHSAFNWAVHSIDRPQMLASYLRFKQFMATAGAPQQGFPSRLAGTLKIPLPFMPDFMGHNVYIDPLKLGLPFEGWQNPFDQFAAQEQTDLGAASRELQAMVNDGKITAADQADALKSHAGPLWDQAVAQAQLNDQQGGSNYMDLLTSLMPPHLPLMYAYDAAFDPKNRPTPIPIARSLDGFLQTLGVAPGMTPGGPGAAIRKALGLHGFGAWDDYYAEREVTNELGLSKISVDDARQAMLTHQGPVWEAAVKKAAIETSGGGPMGAAIALAGVPVKAFPPGEDYLRSLAPEYKAAWAAYDQGDMQAVNKFNDAHPGYEERLALFKSPEARLHQFTQDQFWNVWNGMPTLTRDELKNQLSPDFKKMVSYAAPGSPEAPDVKAFRRNVPTEQLAVWLKLMGSTPIGTLGTEAKPLSDVGGTPGPNLDLASPELAQRAQVFYTMRSGSFPDWYNQQKAYHDIPAGQKVDQGPRDSALAQQYLQARDAQFPDIQAKLAQYDAFGASSKARTAYAKANGVFDYFNFRKQFAADNPNFKNAIGFNDVVKENTPTARSLYAQQHPQLTTYWAWRDDFLKRNPDLAPYLSDQTKGGTVQAPPKPAMQQAPKYTPQEWQMNLGWNLYNLVQDTAHNPGQYPLSPVARDQLAKKAKLLGYNGTPEQLVALISSAGQQQ